MIDALIEEGEVVLRRKGGGRGNSAVYQLASYSELGELAAFGDISAPAERVTLKPLKDDPGANKGGKPPSMSAVEHKKPTKIPINDPRVVEIYEAYPLKKARPTALLEIAKALKKIDAPTLLEKTKSFAQCWNDGDKTYCPNPSTWYHQERYNDDPSTWRRNDPDKKAHTKGSRTTGTANARRTGQYDKVGKV